MSAEGLLKERKHFSQSVMVSVAVSKLAKTDLVFVQLGAKINSVCYCENVLKQGLLPAIRHILNNDFVFQQDGVPAHCVPVYLSSLNQKKWPPNSLDLNPADYSVWTTL